MYYGFILPLRVKSGMPDGESPVKLLIMRHGEAKPFGGQFEDDRRPLTRRGSQLLEPVANKLAQFEPELILVSPFLRTQQTADIVTEQLPNAYQRKNCDWLLSESPVEQAVLQLDKLVEDKVLMVSHMPFVSLLVEYLTGQSLGFRPGDVVQLEFDFVGRGQGECHWIT